MINKRSRSIHGWWVDVACVGCVSGCLVVDGGVWVGLWGGSVLGEVGGWRWRGVGGGGGGGVGPRFMSMSKSMHGTVRLKHTRAACDPYLKRFCSEQAWRLKT